MRPSRSSLPLVSLAVLTAFVILVTAPAPRAAACSTTMIPAYFYAGPLWDEVITSPGGPTTMILNPASGPGTTPDPTYQGTVQRARAAGVRVLGYVHTSWGLRRSSTVRAEVDRYASWYRVDGIFFDEAATGSSALSYYRGLHRHVKSTIGGHVALNHGTIPDRRYMDVSDVSVTFEGDSAAHASAVAPTWGTAYGPGRFAHLVYDADGAELDGVVARAGALRVGNLYVTDDRLNNPWDTLPSYFSSERSLLARGCAAA